MQKKLNSAIGHKLELPVNHHLDYFFKLANMEPETMQIIPI